MVLQAIKYQRGKLEILDQLKLPYQEDYLQILSDKDAWDAIKKMQVRGAPAIAIVAALSIAIWLDSWLSTGNLCEENQECPPSEMVDELRKKLDYLVTSRPTAVNLSDATRKLEHVILVASRKPDVTARRIAEACLAAAEQMLVDDIHDNEEIGKYGAEWLLGSANAEAPEGKISILTHCNTGSLATAGYGTALGVVRALHAQSLLRQCYYTETRPYNQGCRLTGYELMHDNIPATLVTDSMAAALLRLKGKTENIAAIVVGADRVAANGDTANKIGTYGLAILARHHGVRFLVAAPRTTIDLQTKSGEDIVIEERPQVEVTTMRGPLVERSHPNSVQVEVEVGTSQEISIAAAKTKAWNPAFDVTPAELIDGIITEVGVVEKENGAFNLQAIFEPTISDPGE